MTRYKTRQSKSSQNLGLNITALIPSRKGPSLISWVCQFIRRADECSAFNCSTVDNRSPITDVHQLPPVHFLFLALIFISGGLVIDLGFLKYFIYYYIPSGLLTITSIVSYTCIPNKSNNEFLGQPKSIKRFY